MKRKIGAQDPVKRPKEPINFSHRINYYNTVDITNKISLGPGPKPTPARIAFSIARYTASGTRAGLKVWE